jgi:hypothetical protein
MRNFQIQDRAAPNLSCAVELKVESMLRIWTPPKRLRPFHSLFRLVRARPEHGAQITVRFSEVYI